MMIKDFSKLVMFSHTIFAMPFALIGFTYAITCTEAQFNVSLLLLVIICMITARNTAMGFNRWIDSDIDAKNERTANREIPAQKLSRKSVLIFVIINAILFIVSASAINPLTALLSPVALFVVLFYSYCKRFTAAAHLVLGLALGIAPVGAYIAITGSFAIVPCILSAVVITWCSGFDIIYALQDADFDRREGLHSIPAKFSAKTALLISSLLHICSAGLLVLFTTYAPQSIWINIGVALFIAILATEHILVTPTKQRNIGIAFGTLNGLASVTLAIFIIIGLILSL